MVSRFTSTLCGLRCFKQYTAIISTIYLAITEKAYNKLFNKKLYILFQLTEIQIGVNKVLSIMINIEIPSIDRFRKDDATSKTT